VYSDADEVELLLNKRPVGRTSAGPSHSYRALFDVKYEPGELTAVSYIGGIEQSRYSLHSTEGPLVVQAEADRSQLRADDSDLSFVSICLCDESGNLASQAEARVTVRVEGAGSLQGLGSARPDNTEGFVSSSHHTYDGRLLAVVRPRGAGEITVSMSAPGFNPVVLKLEATNEQVPSYRSSGLVSVS
jgi:hypothetical protein